MASENGWEPSRAGADILEWVRIPGAEHVSLQFMKGWPSIIMRAFAADYHVNVEPLRDADSAAFTPTNSVATSNHLNATAMDLNWDGPDGRTFRYGIPIERAYPGEKAQAVRDLLDFYEDVIYCGGFWSIRDWMHFQMGYNTWRNARTQDFINRKIRPDGFSTYKRDGTVPPPPPPQLSKADQYALLIIAEGRRRNISERGIKIALATALVESNIKVYANSKVADSFNYPHDAVGSDGFSVGIFQQQVRDTGNGWWWGDAKTCMDPTTSAGLFFDRLARLDYNGPNSSGSYAQAVQKSAFPDRYDQRYPEAEQIYNRLVSITNPPPEEGFLMALSDQQQRELYDAVCGQRPSKSPLRPLAAGANSIGNLRDVVGYIDGSEHWEAVKVAAELGHPKYLALLREVAGADPTRYPDRQEDALLAQAILADIEAAKAPPQASVSVENLGFGTGGRAAAPPQIVYVDRPAPEPVAQPVALADTNGAVVETKSTGQIIGDAYDALQQLRLADALPIEDRAPLAALIAVLQTKNGSELGSK